MSSFNRIEARSSAARRVSGWASRLLLDRDAEFWLGQLDAVRSLSQIRARVVEVIAESPDTRTFVLRPNGLWRGHRAGQFTAVEVEIDGVRTRRCYSISSAPHQPLVSITVKRVPGGRVSGWLHDHLLPGQVLGLGPAAGELVLPDPLPEKLLLYSGGSGITPVMSILRDLSARGAVKDVVFVHHARSRGHVIFREALETLAHRHDGLRLELRLDDEPGSAGGFDEAWIAHHVPDFAERLTMLCAPPGLMERVEMMWERAGAQNRLLRERFVVPSVPALSSLERDGSVRVRLAAAGRSVVAQRTGSLLDQLERAGERPTYGCRIGICRTCTCRKRTGTVLDLITGAVSSEPDEDIRLCVSAPGSDLELEL